ncbi:hypothetical protein POX_e06653 [Penicillium oxalicum]|uniref:hypothetical protein n=1 Tax=Penicillium oxalicum TaxID=69781 RepID=UPI0020B7D49B|nr:hypothetical protein POX_e06653 [Penicillium oxalicum]KAI2788632.1 hypothetical protein POX_e06653 [Penicillium oxalicum]
MEKKDNILREAGTLERIYNANHYSGFYPCFCLSALYKLQDGLELSSSEWEQLMVSAISSFVLNHGALCSGVVGEDGQHPTFVRLESLDLDQLIEFSTVDTNENLESALLQTLDGLHSKKWTRLHEMPGWKVILLGHAGHTNQVFVILAAHHAFMDGQGGMVFHRELLRALNSEKKINFFKNAPVQESLVKVPPSVKLPPPVEDLMGIPTTWGFHAHNLWGAIRPAWLRNPFAENPWTGNPVTQDCVSNYQSRTRLSRIEQSDLQRLLTRCKENHITPTSLFQAIAVAVLAKLVPPHSFFGHSPYSLRKWTGSDPVKDIVNQTGDSGCLYQKTWISAFKNSSGNKSDETALLWKIAKFHREQLTKELAQVPVNNGLATLGRYTDRHAANAKCIGQVRPLTFEVSNLGRIDLEQTGEAPNQSTENTPSPQKHMRVSRMTFTQSAMVNCAPLTLSIVSMSDGLAVSTSWQPEALDETIAERFCEGISDWLAYLGSES